MNVPPAVPATPPAPRGRTDRDRPAGEEAPDAFGQLLASASAPADEDPTMPSGDVADADGPEGAAPGRAAAGEVTAAVHAAIAAWRADPADVALGAHLREVLRATVQAGRPGAPDGMRGRDGAQAVEGAGESVAAPLPAGAPGETTAPAAQPPSDLAVADPVAPAPSPVTAGAPDAASSPEGTVAAPDPATPAPVTAAAPVRPPVAPAGGRDAAAPPTTVPTDRPAGAAPASGVGAGDRGPEADRVSSDAPRPVSAPAPEASTTAADAVVRSGDPAPTPPRPAGAGVTAAATLDRVLRAVEALEHAPPPRRLAIEVEGVQLSVALRGDEVSVAVRGGADQLPPGWQRDLATVLRGRGLDLASGGEAGNGQGQPARDGTPGRPDHLPGRRPTDPRPGPPLESRPADAAGLRL